MQTMLSNTPFTRLRKCYGVKGVTGKYTTHRAKGATGAEMWTDT